MNELRRLTAWMCWLLVITSVFRIVHVLSPLWTAVPFDGLVALVTAADLVVRYIVLAVGLMGAYQAKTNYMRNFKVMIMLLVVFTLAIAIGGFLDFQSCVEANANEPTVICVAPIWYFVDSFCVVLFGTLAFFYAHPLHMKFDELDGEDSDE